jgi:hypothetical protein
MKGGEPIRLDYSTFLESPPDINEFSNSMVIFDDYDTVTPAKLNKAVQGFIDDIAIMGRKHSEEQGNITMMCLSHYLSNYKSTRIILSETSHFLLYPQSTSAGQLNAVVERYVGLDKDDVKRMKRMGRWVCIHKNYPMWLLSANHAELLHVE